MREKGPVRILQVFGSLGLGGAESRVVDLYRHLDRSRVQFDFLVHTKAEKGREERLSSKTLTALRKPEYFDPYITKLGGRIFAVPRFTGRNYFAYKKALQRFFAEHEGEWKMVQGHMTSTAAIYLPIAKKYGAGQVIPHVRSAGTDPGLKGIVTGLLRRPLRKSSFADYRFACTKQAARAVYGEDCLKDERVCVIPNAVDVQNFVYQEEVREDLRTELGLTSAVVIGHVGRFHYAKNHEFLLQVFVQMKKLLQEDARNEYTLLHGLPLRLLLLGEGERMDGMRDLAKELGIGEEVLFLGNRSNASAYYQAMDYFLFPSRYEGLPGTVVEAQVSGLQCLLSDAITDEVDLTELVSRKSLQDQPETWAKKVLDDLILKENSKEKTGVMPFGDRSACSQMAAELVTDAGFDVLVQAKRMQEFYETGRMMQRGNSETWSTKKISC